MKCFLITLALLFVPTLAQAQCNGVFPNNTVCGNITGSGNLPKPTPPTSFQGSAGGTNGQVQYNNSNALSGFTANGDASINTSTGTLTLTPTGVISGSYGSTTQVPQIILDAKGRTTSATNVAIVYPTPLSMQWRSPMDPPWNAVCDGTTDDLTPLRAWITAIANVYWGYIPQGHTCGMSQLLIIPTGISIYGNRTSGFKCINSANAACGVLLTDAAGGTAPGPGYVTIKGMKFDGNSANRIGPFSYAEIYAAGARHVRIEDNYLVNCAADCIYIGGNGLPTSTSISSDIIVRGNYADTATRNPASFVGGDQIWWLENDFRHGGTAPGTCLDVEPDSINTADTHFVIAHNIFTLCGNGLVINPGAISSSVQFGWGFANISNSNTVCGYDQYVTPTTIAGFKMAGAGGDSNGTLLCHQAYDALP